MKRILTALAATLPFAAHAADAITGEVQRQPTNWQAIVMFLIFVVLTLYITYWASKRVRSRNDYYTAGGNITGFQNGLAIAGDFMSAASFLGISALVYTSGYDGLIYSLGFLVGWPIILFLIAERLRNLGRYTFADVASAQAFLANTPRQPGLTMEEERERNAIPSQAHSMTKSSFSQGGENASSILPAIRV